MIEKPKALDIWKYVSAWYMATKILIKGVTNNVSNICIAAAEWLASKQANCAHFDAFYNSIFLDAYFRVFRARRRETAYCFHAKYLPEKNRDCVLINY